MLIHAESKQTNKFRKKQKTSKKSKLLTLLVYHYKTRHKNTLISEKHFDIRVSEADALQRV